MRLRVVALALVAAVFAAVWLGWQVLPPAPALADGGRLVQVPAHAGILSIATTLWRGDAIRSPSGFVLLSLARGSSRRLHAGEHQVRPAATALSAPRPLQNPRIKPHPLLPP